MAINNIEQTSILTTAQHLANVSSLILVVLFIMALSISIGAALALEIVPEQYLIQTHWQSILFEWLFYITILIALYVYINNRGLEFPKILFKNHSNNNYFKLTITTLFLASFTIALFLTVYWPLTLLAPELLLDWVLDSSPVLALNENKSGLSQIILFPTIIMIISAVIIAPVIEEIFFRGLLFQCLSLKFNIRYGMILSSVLFAVLHSDIISSFVFSIFMCLIYLKSSSLLAPIFCHIFNNAIAYLIEITRFVFNDFQFVAMDIAHYQSLIYLGITLLLISLPWLFLFLKNHRNLCQLPCQIIEN